MLKFHTIGQIEHGVYPFEDAVTSARVFNGAFGTVADGKFSVAANALKAIMLIEVGDDMALDKYAIPEGVHVRVIDLEKIDGKFIEVYDYPLPDAVAVGDKLASDASGALVTGASAAPYLEVTKIIGNKEGVLAKVVAKDASVGA